MGAGAGYWSSEGRGDAFTGGVTMVPVKTSFGTFKVWTKRIGNNPEIRLLFLHGGPGGTHEYFECADSYLPPAGIEYHYYDQLGSYYSDQPDDEALLSVDRFVDEVEQVRLALSLDSSNFFLLGHSWGGALAIEYALRHQAELKGLVISNMMSSAPAYNAYAEDVLMPAMDQDVLAEIKGFEARGETADPRFEELLMEHHYVFHVLRRPLDEWPEPVVRMFKHLNPHVYVPMQGPSELGLSGILSDWDRTDELATITVPTLVIGAEHDTMDPAFMAKMAELLPNGQYLHCPDGSHCAMYDDQERYFSGLIGFLERVSSAG